MIGPVRQRVAALYVDPLGPYPQMPDVDAWAPPRDARDYAGPHPIVAHPPCGPWSHLRALHTHPEQAWLGVDAVTQVRAWGGVLEHPAGSKLFVECCVPHPSDGTDALGGYTIEINQCEWGHVARKRTWLYLVGVPWRKLEAPPFPGREPTHWVSGSRTAPRGPVPPGIKVCSSRQRNRTPPLLAAYLVRLAAAAR